MSVQSESVVALRSAKAQLEVALIYLRRRHAELKRQLAALETQRPAQRAPVDTLAELQRTIEDHAAQIELRSGELHEMERQIEAALRRPATTGAEQLTVESEALTAELVEIREQVLGALRDLARPLRRFEELSERKAHLAGDIAARTGRNLAYQNYIDSALFRQSEFVDDLRYVVELIRQQRVAT
jgi:chromosome segregation ATPase